MLGSRLPGMGQGVEQPARVLVRVGLKGWFGVFAELCSSLVVRLRQTKRGCRQRRELFRPILLETRV